MYSRTLTLSNQSDQLKVAFPNSIGAQRCLHRECVLGHPRIVLVFPLIQPPPPSCVQQSLVKVIDNFRLCSISPPWRGSKRSPQSSPQPTGPLSRSACRAARRSTFLGRCETPPPRETRRIPSAGTPSRLPCTARWVGGVLVLRILIRASLGGKEVCSSWIVKLVVWACWTGFGPSMCF